MKHKLFSILVLLVFAFSCKKSQDDPHTIEISYLDPKLYDYVIFPIGSWWVYEEENTGEKDTLSIIEKHQYVPEEDPLEHSVLFVKSTFYEKTLQYTSIGYQAGSETLYSGGTYKMYVTYLLNGQSTPTNYAQLTYYEYDSLEIAGTTFYDVVKLENFVDNLGTPDCYENFTSAKNIGLIQHVTCYDNKTWNLIDYQINTTNI